ncbi:MAG: hypothetical protein K2K47_04855 [Duncaniella sp.]|nr:hypothetical protein [Duncaniella sp.]
MVEKYLLYSRIFFVTLWVMLTFGFVSQEIITPLKSLHVAVFLIADAIFLLLGAMFIQNRRDILVLIVFLFLGIISSMILNREGFVITFNGTRTYFGLIFAIPILRYFMSGKNADRFIASFDKLLFYFLLLQIPCVAWQFIKYGAGDRVGGSLGDWSSGVISALIYASSFYLVSRRWDYNDFIGSLRKNYVYFLLLLPTFFNETKASFLYLVAYFLLLLPLNIKMAKQLFWILPLMMVVISGLGVLYLKVTNQDADRVLSYDFVEQYLFGESTEHVVNVALAVEDDGLQVDETWGNIIDIPRFSKLIVLPSIFKESHKSMLWGAGLGQFKGTNVVGFTPFSKRNYWLLRGSKPWIFYIIVELGILGLVWNLWLLISMFSPRSVVTNGLNIKFFVGFQLLFLFFYSDALINLYYCSIMFYILLSTQYASKNNPHLKKDEYQSEALLPTE